MAKIIEEGLAKEGSVMLQPGFTTRFLVTSNKKPPNIKKGEELKSDKP